MDMKTFTEQLEAQAKQWQQQAEEFQKQLPNIADELKKQYENNLATMNESAVKAQEMAVKLKDANEAAWKDMAEGAQRSYEEWHRAVQSAISRFQA